jgi:putative oxidoreductase
MLKRILFGGVGCCTGAVDVGMLILRVFTGLFLAIGHGRFKLPPDGLEKFQGALAKMQVPAPGLAGWMAMLAEFVGGILLALGLLTRPAAAVIVINMVVAIATAHRQGPVFMQSNPTGGSMEPALLYLVPALFFVFAGSGRYGVDALLAGRADELEGRITTGV